MLQDTFTAFCRLLQAGSDGTLQIHVTNSGTCDMLQPCVKQGTHLYLNTHRADVEWEADMRPVGTLRSKQKNLLKRRRERAARSVNNRNECRSVTAALL